MSDITNKIEDIDERRHLVSSKFIQNMKAPEGHNNSKRIYCI